MLAPCVGWCCVWIKFTHSGWTHFLVYTGLAASLKCTDPLVWAVCVFTATAAFLAFTQKTFSPCSWTLSETQIWTCAICLVYLVQGCKVCPYSEMKASCGRWRATTKIHGPRTLGSSQVMTLSVVAFTQAVYIHLFATLRLFKYCVTSPAVNIQWCVPCNASVQLHSSLYGPSAKRNVDLLHFCKSTQMFIKIFSHSRWCLGLV